MKRKAQRTAERGSIVKRAKSMDGMYDIWRRPRRTKRYQKGAPDDDLADRTPVSER